MKGFFKIIFGSLIGFMLAIFVISMFFVGLAGKSAKGKKYKTPVNSVLQLKLAPSLPDKIEEENPLEGFANPFGMMSVTATVSLFELKEILEHAKEDNNIKGILLQTDFINEGYPSLFTLREALGDFKSSGKFIYSYNNLSTQKSYLVSSIADKIYLNPAGMFEFDGLVVSRQYYKGIFDKLDIKPVPLYAGEYKSASEPYRRTDMSKNAKYQLSELLKDIYGNYKEAISKSRGIASDELERLADNLSIKTTDDALTNKLVDGLLYEDELYDKIRAELSFDSDKDLSIVELKDYKKVLDNTNSDVDDKIAIVYAEGAINMGEGSSTTIGGEKFMKMIRKIRKDDDVKAIVLRVNSPGGSAFASDQIWRELVLAKEDKPLIVSMGNYAASGGYYIACMADSIFAGANTITGSIGVVGIMLNMQDFFKNKIGLTYDKESTGPYADYGTPMREWSEVELNTARIQIQKVYDDFKKRVAEGRDMTLDKVEEIAQGRVWTGQDAIDIGLVDAIGTMDDALAAAASMAGLEDYEAVQYPEKHDFFEKLISDLMSTKVDQQIRATLGDGGYQLWKDASMINNAQGIQAIMPYEIIIE